MDKAQLESLLATMVRSNATTLHLVAGYKPSVRLSGHLTHTEGTTLTAKALDELSREFLFDDHRQRLDTGHEVQVLYSSQDGVRFRTVVMRQAKGLSMVFRRIPTEIPTIAELELPPLCGSFLEFRSGFVLLTGFLGSGKSTTLAALVNHINQNTPHHIVTIEDPIEFIHNSARSMVHQREVGFHVDSFAQGIQDGCRHGARVLVVGEVRDYETLDACVDAAEKGALVLSTTHASSVVAGLTELMGLCHTDNRARMRLRLSAVLRVMMSQTLLNKVNNTGRVPLVEILINSQSVGKTIRAGRFQELPELMMKGRGLGMQTSDMALRALLLRNFVTEEEALYHAIDREAVLARKPVHLG